MAHLLGLQEYLDELYDTSILDQALDSKQPWVFHLHNHRIVQATVTENLKYDIKVKIEGEGEELLPKVNIKLVYPEELSESVRPLLKTDKKTKDLGLDPILAPGKRYHVKNKTLFPLMKEKKVVFMILLEGEIVRGIIAGFSRYEITVHLKGGAPITILRHSIYDLRDKKGRCFLKSFQDKHRDWEESELFVESSSGQQGPEETKKKES
jgi:sRNA-binding regulator protein Hfq